MALTRLRKAEHSATGSTRRRRAAFYGSVVALLLAANSGLFEWLLVNVGFDDQVAARWSDTLRNNTLSFVALLVAGLFIDLVVRREQAAHEEAIVTRIESRVGAIRQAERQAILIEVEDRLHGTIETFTKTVTDQLTGQIRRVVEPLISDPASVFSPEDRIREAAARVLDTHPEALLPLARTLVGSSASTIIDEASITFTLIADEFSPNYYDVHYQLRGKPRSDTFGVAFVRGSFSAENCLIDSDQVTDTWVLIDDEAYEQTLAYASGNECELRWTDATTGARRTERRPFGLTAVRDGVEPQTCATPRLDVHSGMSLFSADVSRPHGCREDYELLTSVRVRLPAHPPGLRWFFDSPTFVEEVVYDVSQLWPSQNIAFAVYPFMAPTEDFTQPQAARLPRYRVGVNGWVARGHGTILVWERLS